MDMKLLSRFSREKRIADAVTPFSELFLEIVRHFLFLVRKWRVSKKSVCVNNQR